MPGALVYFEAGGHVHIVEVPYTVQLWTYAAAGYILPCDAVTQGTVPIAGSMEKVYIYIFFFLSLDQEVVTGACFLTIM